MNGDRPFTGYRFDLENVAAIEHRSRGNYRKWRAMLEEYDWDPPEEIDPREYLTLHNQGNVGSCQGQSLADAAEATHFIETGEVVELSRAWSYLRSQHYDGLLGTDSGSTLDGGTKCAANDGIPPEADFEYVPNYREILAHYRQDFNALADKAKAWKVAGEVPLSSYDDIYSFLASRSGSVQIGIMWGLPDKWEHTSYQSGGGGHAVCFCGYLKVQAWDKPGLLLKNSWGTGWGRDGYCICKDQCVEQMCRARWSVMIGRSSPATPVPHILVDI